MTRDKLIEKMARAICESCGQSTEKFWRDWVNEATAALTALEAAGMAMRNDVLEEAAKVADDNGDRDMGDGPPVGYDIAAAIRALARTTS